MNFFLWTKQQQQQQWTFADVEKVRKLRKSDYFSSFSFSTVVVRYIKNSLESSGIKKINNKTTVTASTIKIQCPISDAERKEEENLIDIEYLERFHFFKCTERELFD